MRDETIAWCWAPLFLTCWKSSMDTFFFGSYVRDVMGVIRRNSDNVHTEETPMRSHTGETPLRWKEHLIMDARRNDCLVLGSVVPDVLEVIDGHLLLRILHKRCDGSHTTYQCQCTHRGDTCAFTHGGGTAVLGWVFDNGCTTEG